MKMRAKDRLEYLIGNFDFRTVVDWGCGWGPNHRDYFERAGKSWHGIERHMVYGEPNYPADCLWSCHSLEHVLDIHSTLNEWREKYLKPGGIVCVTVPVYEALIKSGHVHHFHAGTLVYRLLLAGFDVRRCAIKTKDRDITVVARKPMEPLELPADLRMDVGDIEKLAHLLPEPLAYQAALGEIEEWNW